MIDVPDDSCTLTLGHSLGVLLLSFFLLLHNAIILLTFYNPKEVKIILRRSFKKKMISRILQDCSINTSLLFVHFKFTDEGVFGDTDVELDFL